MVADEEDWGLWEEGMYPSTPVAIGGIKTDGGKSRDRASTLPGLLRLPLTSFRAVAGGGG